MKHKTWYGTFSMIITIAMLVAVFTAAVPAKAETGEKKTAMQLYVEDMQPGWNLGNTFDATGDETSWGNPVTTKELIDKIASAGFKSIRIPITWKHRMGEAADYKINEAFMKRIQEVVDWSLADGLYVMVNLHHDSSWVRNMETEHDIVMARFNSAWAQISDHFKAYPDKLMFESINEPRFSDDWGKDAPEYFKMLDELNTSFYKIVRKSGGNNSKRPLVLPALTCSSTQDRLNELSKTISKLKDKNIIATVHYYGYWPFSVNIAGATRFNEDVKNDLVQAWDRAYDTFVSKGIPVIVGEYGLLGFDRFLGTIEHGEMLKYFEFINYYAKEKDLTLMLWDNGQHFNRRTLQWGDEAFYNVIMAGVKSRSSTAETDSIYIKKDTEIKDVNIQMNLNGNTLNEIKNGSKVLSKGIDYDIKGDMLTLKSSFLETIITRQYGRNATLSCKFSGGADWNFDVIYYGTPVLKSAKGTTLSFLIPADFYGDKLATMESTYKSGGNAGPNNWTPYKEFGASFSPLYDSNAIEVTSGFFKEVKDGEVLLKMHFWSGDVVEYTVKKEGAKIIGISSNEPDLQAADETVDNAGEGTAITAGVSKENRMDNVNDDTNISNQAEKTTENSDKLNYLIPGIAAGILILAGIGMYIMKKRKK